MSEQGSAEMVGRKFGRLSVMRRSGRTDDNHITWECACDCGGNAIVPGRYLRSGGSKSCGCLRKKALNKTTHGMRKSTEYSVWRGMLTRCHNPKAKDHSKYGAKGIRVCEEWRTSFIEFYKHIGPRPQGTTIDRIDGTKGYEPGNVRWATAAVQGRNKIDAVYVNCSDGSRVHISDIAARLGITRGAASLRLKRGKLHV
jgi:hypothetical protein